MIYIVEIFDYYEGGSSLIGCENEQSAMEYINEVTDGRISEVDISVVFKDRDCQSQIVREWETKYTNDLKQRPDVYEKGIRLHMIRDIILGL